MKKVVSPCLFLIALVVSVLMGTTSLVASAESKPVMVVATFDAKGFTQEDIEFVMNVFTSSFANLGVVNIVDRSSFDKIKKELSFQDSDWSDSNKVAEMGRALNASEVAVGQLMKRRNKIILTVKILDVNTTTIIASNIGTVDDVDSFLDVMDSFCATLVGKAGGGSSSSYGSAGASIPYGKYNVGDEGPGGGIVFYTSEEGFKVYDGKGGEQVCHYLEMTPKTIGGSYWLPKCVEVGGTKEGLGYGKANTYKILELRYKLDLDEGNCATYRVSQYSTSSTKAGEWFLPSKDELDLIYKNQKDRVLATLWV